MEELLGYVFCDPSLPARALTHASANGASNYERLEFLGDAVLELAASDYLYRTCPDSKEGDLTRLRAGLVCEQALAGWARAQALGAHIRLGPGEEASGGRDKDSILADVTEALIGAVYLDGGLAPAQALVQRILQHAAKEKPVDYKTAFQELAQQQGRVEIAYRLLDERGPAHDKVFTAQVLLNGRPMGEGEGTSKKRAEQAAAHAALGALRAVPRKK